MPFVSCRTHSRLGSNEGIFDISTFDMDYVLVKGASVETAIASLAATGFQIN